MAKRARLAITQRNFATSLNPHLNPKELDKIRGMQGRDATIAWIVISFIPSPACCIHSRINPGGRKELIGKTHRQELHNSANSHAAKDINIVNY